MRQFFTLVLRRLAVFVEGIKQIKSETVFIEQDCYLDLNINQNPLINWDIVQTYSCTLYIDKTKSVEVER